MEIGILSYSLNFFSAVKEKEEVAKVLSETKHLDFLKKKFSDFEYEDEYDDSFDAFSGKWGTLNDKTMDEELEVVSESEDEAESKEEVYPLFHFP
jgi:hypothetical protein